MELELIRKTFKEECTIGVLRETLDKTFILQTVEPPASGIAAPSSIVAYPKGRFKILLKRGKLRTSIVPLLQSVKQRPRMTFRPASQDLSNLSFESDDCYALHSILCGKIIDGKLKEDDYNYTRFLYRMILAKQQKDSIWVNIV